MGPHLLQLAINENRALNETQMQARPKWLVVPWLWKPSGLDHAAWISGLPVYRIQQGTQMIATGLSAVNLPQTLASSL